MPFYEYECARPASYYTEVMQKITDAPLNKCPSCGKLRLKKLVSAPVFRLKGAGWYETDFKSDKENKRNLAGAEQGSSAKAEAKAETKSATSKTDAKAKAKGAARPRARTPKPARQSQDDSQERRSQGAAQRARKRPAGAGRGAREARKVNAQRARR